MTAREAACRGEFRLRNRQVTLFFAHIHQRARRFRIMGVMLLHLLQLKSGGDANSLSDIFPLEPPAGQDDESFRQFGSCSGRKRDILSLVEMAVPVPPPLP